jgi:hypothetical protein
MNNHYKYLHLLELEMHKFLMQDISGDVGYIAPELHKVMAEAAFNVLMAAKVTNDFNEQNRTP